MKASRRYQSLIPLSREHHYGLMLCLRIHRGLPKNGDDEAWVREKGVQAAAFFTTDLTAHFEAEEQVLFPAMRSFAGARELLTELVAEHRKLRRIASRLAGSKVAGLKASLGQFADLLESHIRKEERHLFPLYEKQVGREIDSEVKRAIRALIGDAMQPRGRRRLE
ncbi:MAG TPA: hemerythrin domain-containing protein [Blastocatellia bacterium]|nr:hemerythrin domain-containing protein [Blastocatellia bacterium]